MFVYGQSHWDKQPRVAIVGPIDASSLARSLAVRMANIVGKHHYTPISGLASGVMNAVHASKYPTIAVLDQGVAQLPPDLKMVATFMLAQGGTILTEYPEHIPPSTDIIPSWVNLMVHLAAATIILLPLTPVTQLYLGAASAKKHTLILPTSVSSEYDNAATYAVLDEFGAHHVRNGAELIQALKHYT